MVSAVTRKGVLMLHDPNIADRAKTPVTSDLVDRVNELTHSFNQSEGLEIGDLVTYLESKINLTISAAAKLERTMGGHEIIEADPAD